DGALAVVLDADAWDSTISFAAGVPVVLGGTLELAFAPGVDVGGQVGRTFHLFDWSGVNPTGTFNVDGGPFQEQWNLSNLYSTGDVTFAAIPEPATLCLLALGGVAVLVRRCHGGGRRHASGSAIP
ncbi:MAG: PEP-CTERM sorting domain-containing protein, partial [Planctomycetota bacterium]